MDFKIVFTILIIFYHQLARAQNIISDNSEIIKQYPLLDVQQQPQSNISYQVLLQTKVGETSVLPPPINANCILDNDTIKVFSNNAYKYLGLEYLVFYLTFTEIYDFLKVELDFIKFGIWLSEDAILYTNGQSQPYYIYDSSQQNNIGNPDNYCKNQDGHSTKYSFSTFLVPNHIDQISMTISSKSSIPEREWSISNLKFSLYKCIEEFVFNKDSKKCDPCPQNCLQCLNSNKCMKCKDGLYLFGDSQCLENCPNKYYKDNDQKKCQQCPQSCKTCTTGNMCSSCNDIDGCENIDNNNCSCIEYTKFLQCLKKNPNCKKFKDEENGICDCVLCEQNYFLQNNICVNQCSDSYYQLDQICDQCQGDGYFINGKFCQSCDLSCQSCKKSKDYCKVCLPNLKKVKINQTENLYFCVKDQYPDSDLSAYQKCQLQKLNLNIDSDNNYSCLNCNKFQMTNISNQNIQYCCRQPNCADCSVDYQTCKRCYYSFTFKDNKCQKCSDLFTSQCEQCDSNQCTQCISKFYLKNNSCTPCPFENCINCNDNQCTKCSSNYYILDNKCIDQAGCTNQSGYISVDKCNQCSQNCKTCSPSGQICQACQPGYLLVQNSGSVICQDSCPAEQYKDQNLTRCVTSCSQGYINTQTNQCTDCDDKNCIICQISDDKLKQNCSKCSDKYYLSTVNNECVQNCPIQTFLIQRDSDNQNVCDNCGNGLYYYEQNLKCVSFCPSGYEGTDSKNNLRKCLPCSDSNCKKCYIKEQQEICTQCQNDSYLYKSTCVTDCSSKSMYNDTNTSQCMECPKDCKTCDQTQNCLSCFTGQLLHQGQCISKCPPQYYQTNNTCMKCSVQNCINCDEKQCFECDKNFLLFQNQNYCFPCPSEQYLLDKDCKQCTSLLKIKSKECVNEDQCNNENFIDGNLCLQCQYGKMCEKQTSVSQKQNCKKTQPLCLSCSKGLYLVNGECYPCPEGCTECTSPNSCQSCIQTYCLLNNQCYYKNGLSSVNPNQFCENLAKQNCQQSVGPNYGKCLFCASQFTCSVCDENSYLYNGDCLINCPSAMVTDKNIYSKKYIYSGICREKCLNGYDQQPGEFCFYCPDSCKDCKMLNQQEQQLVGQNYSCQSCSQDNDNKSIFLLEINETKIFKCVEVCPIGQFSQNNICTQCPKYCSKCENENTCVQCKLGYFLDSQTKQCIETCPHGYYANIESNECLKCSDDDCDQCSKATFCIKCIQKNLLNGQCVSDCGKQFYSQDQKCLPCLPNCQECLNGYSCKQCQQNTYLQVSGDNISCQANCQQGFYPSSGVCQSCTIQNCFLCSKSDQCDLCNKGFYLQISTENNSHKCTQICDSGFYESSSSQMCLQCQPNCLKCKDGICSQCQNQYFLEPNASSSPCSKCIDNCQVCKDREECQFCNQGFQYNNVEKKCVCPANQFQLGSECLNCSQNCQSCNALDKCDECQPGFFPSDGVCKPCLENCEKCKNQNSCDQCKQTYFYVEDYNFCQQNNCPEGYFNKVNTQICSKCLTNCMKCEQEYTCDTCNLGFVLSSDLKSCQCPIGQSLVDKNCIQCPNDCLDCTVINQCNKCKEGYLVRSDKKDCVNTCPDGYSKIESQCIKCISNCQECNDSINCKKCSSNFYLDSKNNCKQCQVPYCKSCESNSQQCDFCSQIYVYDPLLNQCKEFCQENQFIYEDSDQKRVCKNCIQNCSECSNLSECQKCQPSFYVDKINNNTCSKCIENCLSCDSNNQSCDKCEKDYYFIPNLQKCVKDCPVGYYAFLDKQVCLQCINNCNQCQNSSFCQKCSASFYLRSDAKDCVDKCPQGYSKVDTNCIKCIDKCEVCQNTDKCTLCKQGYFFNGDFKCVPCEVANCNSCQDSSKQCQICASGFILSSDHSSCLDKCPPGQFSLQVNGNQICSQCIQNCNLCNDDQSCLKCIQGFTLIDGKCASCNVQQCVSCDISVQTCSDCGLNLFVSSNQQKCVSQCQESEYLDQNKKICTKCPLNCTKCYSDQQCVECQFQYYLSNNQQCIQCDSSHYFDYVTKSCVFCDSQNGYFIENNVCKQCNYTCKQCSGITLSECLTCPTNRILYMNRCICQEGYIENASQICEKQQIDTNSIKGVQSAMTSMSAVFVIGGAGFPSSLRGLEISQMASFLTYVDVNYQGNSNQYLNILYSDNLSPIFPNVLKGLFQKEGDNQINSQDSKQNSKRQLEQEVYVDSYQTTDFKFMMNQKTNNFLFNISPMILLHLFVVLLLLVKFVLYKYTKLQYSQKKPVVWIKNNFRSTVFLLIFYLTYQELLLIVLLQLTKPFYENAVSIIGSTLTLLVSLYMIYLVYFIFRVVLFMPYLTVSEKNQKFGSLFYGLKNNRSAQIFVLIKLIQKTVICMSTIYAYHSDQVLPQIVISGIVFLYEIMIRPFCYKLVALASFTLNALYLDLLFLSYLIKSQQQQNVSSISSLNYSNQFENILLAFIIVKNAIILVDIIILIYGFYKVITGKRTLSASTDITTTDRKLSDLESTLSKSITWKNNPLISNNFSSVKQGKQSLSDIQSDFRRTDSIYYSDSQPKRKDSSSPILKKTSDNSLNSSPQSEIDSNQIQLNQVIGKEILVVKWKKNKMIRDDNNDAL